MNLFYIIITPVYNEQLHLKKTIESVLSQTVLPQQWIIVDDGSTDSTAAIIHRYASQVPWIQYIYRTKNPEQSYYASNVYAITEGLKSCSDLDYDYLAILDGDISLPADYYETILTRFGGDPKLGIASGIYMDDVKGKLRKILNDRRSTPKALMVFRRNCYEEIGGFVPMKYGGEDTIACFAARMKGWKSWSFPELIAVHHKPIGTGQAKSLFKVRFIQGVGEYFLAVHPLFMFFKCVRRCFQESPVLIGGMARFSGFICANFMGEKRQLSQELIEFIRKEQLMRLKKGNRIPVEYRVAKY